MRRVNNEYHRIWGFLTLPIMLSGPPVIFHGYQKKRNLRSQQRDFSEEVNLACGQRRLWIQDAYRLDNAKPRLS